MKIAITGGTGFVGRHLARRLVSHGHQVVLISRGVDQRDPTILKEPGVQAAAVGLDDPVTLGRALAGCEAVAHCAGINRELGRQTYQNVHVRGTRHLMQAARDAGVRNVLLLSFLRARPNCGSGYHHSKWEAEQIVRGGGLDYTVIKAGVIYGRGDHMLDHLSHAFLTFPVFALVGFHDKEIRPTAVADMTHVLEAALVEGALSRQTVAVMGPETMTLAEAVARVARVVGKQPWTIRAPVAFHYLLAWTAERLMKTPLVSIAQVQMLAEGIVEPLPPCPEVPAELAPRAAFTDEQIREGLPGAAAFGPSDCRWHPFAKLRVHLKRRDQWE